MVVQRLREVLTAAGKVMRCGSDEERRRAAELLRTCAQHCEDPKIALRLRDMADAMDEGEAELFWGDWWWAWGYWEALADADQER